MDSWQALIIELEREAEAIFATSDEVAVVTPDRDSGSVVTLFSRTKSLRITWVPDKNAVRWDRLDEYSFERIPGDTASLARSLIRRPSPVKAQVTPFW